MYIYIISISWDGIGMDKFLREQGGLVLILAQVTNMMGV